MKKLWIAASMVGAMVASSASYALTYAVVDLDVVAEKNTYLTQQNALIEKNKTDTTAKLQRLDQQLQELQRVASSPQAQSMKEAEVKKMQADYQAKQKEAQVLYEGLQKSVQNSMLTASTTWQKRVAQAGEQLRKEHKVDVILDKKSLVSFDAKYDLTDKMTQLVNAIK